MLLANLQKNWPSSEKRRLMEKNALEKRQMKYPLRDALEPICVGKVKSERKSIKVPLMEIFTRQSVSHITLFHSMVLTLDLFWKTDKFIASRPTVDGYRIDFRHDQRSARIYTDTRTNISSNRTSHTAHTNRNRNRYRIRTCWTENKLPIENTLTHSFSFSRAHTQSHARVHSLGRLCIRRDSMREQVNEQRVVVIWACLNALPTRFNYIGWMFVLGDFCTAFPTMLKNLLLLYTIINLWANRLWPSVSILSKRYFDSFKRKLLQTLRYYFRLFTIPSLPLFSFHFSRIERMRERKREKNRREIHILFVFSALNRIFNGLFISPNGQKEFYVSKEFFRKPMGVGGGGLCVWHFEAERINAK